jgi:hypothetical protein
VVARREPHLLVSVADLKPLVSPAPRMFPSNISETYW